MGAGLLVAMSVPPWGFWPLAFVGLAVLAWRLEGLSAVTRAVVGLVFAAGLFGPTLFWISEFHKVGYVALLLLEGSFFVVACAATPPRRVPLLLALPGALVLAEVARGAVPFGGLPMGGVPLGQAAGPLAPAARVGGAMLVAVLATCAALALLSAARRHWRPAVAFAAVVLAAPLVGLAAPDGRGDAPPRRIRVAIVQGGGTRGFRAVDTDPSVVFEVHLEKSGELEPPLDLVLWPENAVDVFEIDGTREADELAVLAQRLRTTVVVGVTQEAGDDNFENIAIAWAPDGRMIDRYVKAHRVPFGEYVPLRGLLDRVVDLSVLPRDAIAGTGTGVLDTPAGRLGVAISYEVFFSDRSRSAMRADGQILLVPTNAASFTSSQVPTQEVAASRLRAWETGRWVVQSAPTGYGAIVDADGDVLARTTLGEAEILTGRPELRTGRTIYVTVGDTPVVVVGAGLVLVGWWLALPTPAQTGRRRVSRSLAGSTSPSGRATARSASVNGLASRGRRR